ncbi:hypothetical protein Cob_v005045 [Colletotrichum orbiculare MAFF 240422]|uniref:Uncharacterized protein n=1 Tax=Colletotrichum orbiculare (strain 104-T / ATCC 96160 / CBS 514.97 / LARS 414 / MAFF 240422) TaxID=1213857 RepID=A0A484FUW6_COLOR|nr:hypothetical protein Cob_v005045 [Colletotrichum orbiculare MAFF 240422]
MHTSSQHKFVTYLRTNIGTSSATQKICGKSRSRIWHGKRGWWHEKEREPSPLGLAQFREHSSPRGTSTMPLNLMVTALFKKMPLVAGVSDQAAPPQAPKQVSQFTRALYAIQKASVTIWHLFCEWKMVVSMA